MRVQMFKKRNGLSYFLQEGHFGLQETYRIIKIYTVRTGLKSTGR